MNISESLPRKLSIQVALSFQNRVNACQPEYRMVKSGVKDVGRRNTLLKQSVDPLQQHQLACAGQQNGAMDRQMIYPAT
jgi:hypothetical protein